MQDAHQATQEDFDLVLDIFVELLEERSAAVYWGAFEK